MPSTQSCDESVFRLRPHRPSMPRDESKVWSRSFKNLIHLVRMTSKARPPSGRFVGASVGIRRKPHLQICAIRITYSSNRIRGQWGAHGRYIARDSATRGADSKEAGFSSDSDRVDLAKTLNQWQNAGDQRLFKLIISAEFGERLDLRRHTRELLVRMQQDLGVRLEWAAVAHFNTEHPHVHVALRGRTDAGPLRLERDYVKHGIRQHAENLCTAQLGFRTELDALEAERRAVAAPRVTSLDRRIAREAFTPGGDAMFDLNSLAVATSSVQQARHQFLAARLRTLATMDLAEELDQGRWQIDPSFLSTLRAMQTAQDRQRMLTLTGRASLSAVESRDKPPLVARTSDTASRSSRTR